MFQRRCARRSIQTPAGSEKSRCGSQAIAVRIPTSSADACSARIAVSGIASALIWSPKTEIVCAAQTRRNSGCLVRGCGSSSRGRAGSIPMATDIVLGALDLDVAAHGRGPHLDQGASPSLGASPSSSSELVSPLIDLASIQASSPA
jgi:hypothetical protein